jgi:site-specific DNA-methyltransferase (adenine-specific)
MTFRKETLAEGVDVYLGDCLEVLPTLSGVDAVVSDPPYGIGFQKGAGGLGIHPGRVRNLGPIKGDDRPFDPAPFLAWPCVLFGANHYYARLPDGGTFHTWDKSRGVGPDDSFSDAEYVWTPNRRKSEVFRYLWKGVLQDGEKGAPKYHVSQKPISVMEWAIGFAGDAQHILDPYMGSGSTGVAAVRLGKRFTGVEIDEAHFATACARITAALKQPDMFVPAPKPMKQTSIFEVEA